ncbi:glycerol-3-phosphate cytidylyltransferase [Candidatus Gracilibacteria bacterium]|nr:MAG: glycerol-3-phosphate cytidylyltransferase [Candidatus Gracilibacteria bacterium]
MKKIITYGTFDVIHEGHLNLLRKAKSLGDYLVVGLSSDKFNDLKGKKSYQSFDKRKKVLESIKYVDLVISEDNWEQKESDIKKYNINTFVMGSDWKGKFDKLKKYCNIVYLPRTKGISSTKVKKNIFSMFLNKIEITINENTHMFKESFIKLTSLFYIPFFYIFSYVIKKRKGIYVFGSMDGKKISGNSKAMLEFYKKSKTRKCFYMTRNRKLVNNNIIKINSLKNILLLLRAEYIFTDSSASSVSGSLALLGNFKIVRLWHGDTIKKLNFDSKVYTKSIGKLGAFLLKKEYKNNILIPTSSENNKNIMNSCFLGKCAKVTGLPRNDIFFDNKKNIILTKIENYLSLKKYKKIFLYAPTWRDSNNILKPFSKELLKKINNYMKNNSYILLISGHIQTEDIEFDEMSNIKKFKSDYIEIQELLLVCDVLITDYSSIFIDFLLTDKPIVFYSYDLDNYLKKDRELYFNYKDIIINESLVINQYDLFDTIKNIDSFKNNKKYKEEYKKIKNFFHKYQKGGYCEKVNNFLN